MIVWLIKDGEFIEYKRTGRCKKCGECCRHKIRMSIVARSATWADVITCEGAVVYLYRGLYIYVRALPPERIEESECEHFTDERLCDIHRKADRKLVCAHWPVHPTYTQEHFPNCGFKFRKVKDEV